MPLALLSPSFQALPPATHKHTGPFWWRFPGRWICVCSRTLWVSPTGLSYEAGSFSLRYNAHRFSQSEV